MSGLPSFEYGSIMRLDFIDCLGASGGTGRRARFRAV